MFKYLPFLPRTACGSCFRAAQHVGKHGTSKVGHHGSTPRTDPGFLAVSSFPSRGSGVGKTDPVPNHCYSPQPMGKHSSDVPGLALLLSVANSTGIWMSSWAHDLALCRKEAKLRVNAHSWGERAGAHGASRRPCQPLFSKCPSLAHLSSHHFFPS